MITLTASQARDCRAVFRRLGAAPAVELAAGPGGLAVRGRSAAALAELRMPGAWAAAALAVPLAALAGRGPVTVAAEGDRVLATRPAAGPRGRRRAFDTPGPAPPWPAPAGPPAANPPGLLAALARAARTTGTPGGPYAWHLLLLRGGAGEVVAGDGRQLLAQGGFDFPWAGDVLADPAGVPAARAAGGRGPVGVGLGGGFVWLVRGAWSVGLAAGQAAAFPEPADVVPPAAAAAARWRLDRGDAAALGAFLGRLRPGRAGPRPVVLAAAGGVPAVRAVGRPARGLCGIVLRRSAAEGRAGPIRTDPAFLARALRLGFTEFDLGGPGRPVVGRDARRRYAWAPLAPRAPGR